MAFLTQNLLVQAGERKGRTRMVKAGSWFPGLLIVTAQAVSPELLLMRLLVARNALAR